MDKEEDAYLYLHVALPSVLGFVVYNNKRHGLIVQAPKTVCTSMKYERSKSASGLSL
jgi:hypothetical protein